MELNFVYRSLIKVAIVYPLLPLILPLSSVTASQKIPFFPQPKLLSPTHNLIASENQKRTALVIGNSAYQKAKKLANPVNDASDMAKTWLSRHNEVKCFLCYILGASVAPLRFDRILDCRGVWRAPFVR